MARDIIQNRTLEEEKVGYCFGHAEPEVPVGHLAGDVQQAGRNMGVELGREFSDGIVFL